MGCNNTSIFQRAFIKRPTNKEINNKIGAPELKFTKHSLSLKLKKVNNKIN